jgi:hypothetical protein
MKWGVFLMSILACALSMDTALPENYEKPATVTTKRVRKALGFSEISCKRCVKSAVVTVKWQGTTLIPGPYNLIIYYDVPGSLFGLVQTVNILDFDHHEVEFAAGPVWKSHCEKQVYFELRGGRKKICNFGTASLAAICPNVIQKDDVNPDDTDMLFSVPGKRSPSW